MPAGLADFVHDAAVLHRFVDFIEEYCKEQERSQTYVDASGLFFKYVEKLAAGTKRQLQKEIKRATRFPKRLPVLRSNLLTLKNYLRLLHALIKPATDAHTLSVPTPLVDLASQQLQSVQGMKNSRIVILLTPEFMYFQRPHTEIKDQARIVRSFNPTHPAIACRLAEHVDLLRKDLWWNAIAYVDADQKKLLESLAKEPRSKYGFYLDEKTPGPISLVDAFIDTILPLIRKLVRHITPQNAAAVERFAKERTSIEDCLRVGVVPARDLLKSTFSRVHH